MVVATLQFDPAWTAQVSQLPAGPGEQRMGCVNEAFDEPGIVAGNIITDKDDRVRPVLYLREGSRDPAAGLQRFQVVPGMAFPGVE